MAVIWEAIDRLGRLVVLTDEGWAHIVDRHEDMVEFQREIHTAVALAEEVCVDAQHPRRNVHYLRPAGDRPPLRVVVNYRPTAPSHWSGEVITAFRSERKAKSERTIRP